jgi:hypothetical protein
MSLDSAMNLRFVGSPARSLVTNNALFYACLFQDFCFNVPYQFTSRPNLLPFILGLMFFGWFTSTYLSPFFL